MINQQKLKIGSIAVTLIMFGMIGFQVMNANGHLTDDEDSTASNSESIAQLTPRQFGTTERPGRSDETSSNSRGPVGTLHVGRIGATPSLEEIQSLRQLPLLGSQISRAYQSARSMTCRMLTPGASVKPTVTFPRRGESGTVGRVPTITIGLIMDPNGRSKLPAVTRGQVEKYFNEHRLSIQPTVYSDKQGQLYFGTDCQAAFYEMGRPGVAIQAEPMIESAVQRFRALGVAAPKEASSAVNSAVARMLSANTGRTLVMAFSFEKADLTISSIGADSRKVTELIFLHLPVGTEEEMTQQANVNSRNPISVDVYLTSDERRNLHRLELNNWEFNSPTPDISADVRFDKMILMGLYPAEPVVTDIHYRSGGIISMELISQLMAGDNEQTAMSLDDVLDQFGLLSESQYTSETSGMPDNTVLTEDEDQRWLQEVARLKYERLEKALQPVGKKDNVVIPPKVPLMTGLDD